MAGLPGFMRGAQALPRAGRRNKRIKPATAAPASTRPTHCTCTCSMPISRALFPCFACYPSLLPACLALRVRQRSGSAWKSGTPCSLMPCSGMTWLMVGSSMPSRLKTSLPCQFPKQAGPQIWSQQNRHHRTGMAVCHQGMALLKDQVMLPLLQGLPPPHQTQEELTTHLQTLLATNRRASQRAVAGGGWRVAGGGSIGRDQRIPDPSGKQTYSRRSKQLWP